MFIICCGCFYGPQEKKEEHWFVDEEYPLC